MQSQGNVSPRARNAFLRRLLSQSTKPLLCAACQGHARAWHCKSRPQLEKNEQGRGIYFHSFIVTQLSPFQLSGTECAEMLKKTKKKGEEIGQKTPLLRLSIQNSTTAISGLPSKKHLHGLHTAAAAFRLSVQMIQGQGT